MTNEVVPLVGASSARSGDQPVNPAYVEDHPNHDSDADALPHDEEASYCSTTSEESLAHSDADDQDDDDDDDDEAAEAGDTISSPSRTSGSARRTVRTPSFSYDDLARRPRSNPRTRTPLRNPSPLLHGLRREEPNVSGMQRPASQDAAGSATSAVAASEAASFPQVSQQQRVTIRLNAGLPVGSLPSHSSASTARASTSQTTTRRRLAHQSATVARSTKQGPSRRKVRRWTNDSMRSVAVELARSNTRGSRAAADVYAGCVADGALRRRYEMPNAPRHYRSSFDLMTRLVDRWEVEDEEEEDDDHPLEEEKDEEEEQRENRLEDGLDGHGDNPAESYDSSFRGGGNSSCRRQKDDNARSQQKKKDLERKKKKKKQQRAELLAARDRFLRGEIAAAAVLVNRPTNEPSSSSSNNDDGSRFASGPAMFRHLDPRIRSIVVRAVSSASTSYTSTSTSTSISSSPPMMGTTPTTYAARLLHAMEDLLVHRKMASDESRTLVDEILARPLVVDTSSGDGAEGIGDGGHNGNEIEDDKSNKEDKNTKKKKKSKKDKKTKNKSSNHNKVGSMAHRFHFEAAGTNNATAGNSSSGGGGKNAGFHRLLLHAVCQFHGMNASSSTCSYYDENLGDGRRQKATMERVLTVTGTCRGREHRIVDEACRYMVEAS